MPLKIVYINHKFYPTSLRLLRHRLRILAEFGLHVAAMLVAFLQIFVRFSDVFRGFGTFWERLAGLYRFVEDLKGFGSILGQFWGPMLEPVWKPRRLEIGNMSIFFSVF